MCGSTDIPSVEKDDNAEQYGEWFNNEFRNEKTLTAILSHCRVDTDALAMDGPVEVANYARVHFDEIDSHSVCIMRMAGEICHHL